MHTDTGTQTRTDTHRHTQTHMFTDTHADTQRHTHTRVHTRTQQPCSGRPVGAARPQGLVSSPSGPPRCNRHPLCLFEHSFVLRPSPCAWIPSQFQAWRIPVSLSFLEPCPAWRPLSHSKVDVPSSADGDLPLPVGHPVSMVPRLPFSWFTPLGSLREAGTGTSACPAPQRHSGWN